MRRVQIQLDESTYEALRRRAFAQRQSLAGTVRELLRQSLGNRGARRGARLQSFSFIGAASVRDAYPVSEEHDRALAEREW